MVEHGERSAEAVSCLTVIVTSQCNKCMAKLVQCNSINCHLNYLTTWPQQQSSQLLDRQLHTYQWQVYKELAWSAGVWKHVNSEHACMQCIRQTGGWLASVASVLKQCCNQLCLLPQQTITSASIYVKSYSFLIYTHTHLSPLLTQSFTQTETPKNILYG